MNKKEIKKMVEDLNVELNVQLKYHEQIVQDVVKLGFDYTTAYEIVSDVLKESLFHTYQIQMEFRENLQNELERYVL